MSSYYANLKIDEKMDSLSKKISIEIDKSNIDEFQLKMILSGCSGLIKPSVKYEENSLILEYDVSNMINFEKIFNTKKNVAEIIDITLDLIDIVNQSTNHYLDYSLFLMDKKFMFYNSMSSQVMLIYLPVLNFTESDILQIIKSEMFKDASKAYREFEYSNLLFTIMSSSTLMGLKHSLIDLESKLYDKSKVHIDIREEDESRFLQIHKPKIINETITLKDDKKIKSEDSSEKILKIIVIAVVSILTISVFIFGSLSLKLPLIPSIIVGSIISLLVTVLIFKLIEKKSRADLKDELAISYKSEDKKIEKGDIKKVVTGPKTILISDLKNKYKLVNLDSGEVHPLIFSSSNIVLLGRSNLADIYIEESSIGRNHLNIINKSEEIYMCDNNSLNGTFINEMQLKPLRNYLTRDGDIICVGETKLKLQIG
ncbi:MAG: FHA domain-containing protein [Acidaminobacteraceae bacterium]